MAHHLYWPGKYFFYPIGNTSAVSLARDLAPEENANILLLGCGDPRHVLYTIYNELPNSTRKSDFTCCDFDPAVLARNIILFTMVVENESPQTIWNIFFHMKIDKATHERLRVHCEKLVNVSASLGNWNASPYGSYTKMCTEYTLTELRRHWSLYATMRSLPVTRLKQIREAFQKMMDRAEAKLQMNLSSARSCGPLILEGESLVSQQFRNYWKTGTTFHSPKQISSATVINPTFVYSLGGEGCCVHYGLDPMVPFHLADVVASVDAKKLGTADLVKAAQKQFGNWCDAYRDLISNSKKLRLVLRFIVGDAAAVSRAFDYFTETKVVKTNIPCAHWKSSPIEFDPEEYVSQNAPSVFNVVETSNLTDHIGLLNVLISASFVLANNGVLYSEGLLYQGGNATKDFTERLHADISLMGLLLGLCPVDYMSSFNARSNTHELMITKMMKSHTHQFHQVTTWKPPTSGDVRASGVYVPFNLDPVQLGTALWDLYHRLFELDDSKTFWNRLPSNQRRVEKAIMFSTMIRYTRQTFVLFLKVIRDRLHIPHDQWTAVMERFINTQQADKSMPMDTVNSQELWALLYSYGIFTVPLFGIPTPPIVGRVGRFSNWTTVPHIVRVILTIPREKLNVLVWPKPKDPNASDVMTIPLHCYVTGTRTLNNFIAVDVAFGRVSKSGTSSHPKITFEEDPQRWEGNAPLVASFVMPTQLLLFHEPQSLISVHFVVHDTPGQTMSPTLMKLGLGRSIFSAPLLDEQYVHVLPAGPPGPVSKLQRDKDFRTTSSPLEVGIGKAGNAVVELDDDCEVVSSFTTRINITSTDVKAMFSSGTTPEVFQTSPCMMQLAFGKYKQDIVFPFPISGSGNRLRLARKSQWIEVVVPPYAPFEPDAIKFSPFPVVGTSPALTSWNLHRVNLDRSPIIRRNDNLDTWFNNHVGSMLSARERSLREKKGKDVRMFVKDSLHSLLVGFSGAQNKSRPQVFSLTDTDSDNCDTILFAKELRFDLQSHTVVCDGYVLPLTKDWITRNSGTFGRFVHESGMVRISSMEGEMPAWKHLLPAMVERCRTWQHNPNCEYEATGRIPLSEKMEEIPLCSCGRGKDVDGMKSVELWRPFAPYSWRIALSPLFSVSYLERVLGSSRKCHVCRAQGKPKLQACSMCKKTRYCSRECQKADWRTHKEICTGKA